MAKVRRSMMWTGALAALGSLLSAPMAEAAGSRAQRKLRDAPVAMPLALGGGLGSFTPAGDPRRSAALARGGLAPTLSGGLFRFTPSGNPGSRRAVTVAVRARSTNQAASQAEAVRVASLPSSTLAPSAYSLGLAVGWKRFAISGDIARVQGSLLPENRESAEIGLAYAGRSWVTRLALGSDRSIGEHPRMIGTDESYSADLSGSYALTRNIDLTGGLRYRVQRDRIEPLADTRRDSQSIYVGTAFRF